MSDQSPLVTVYIPTYNRADLLKRAVESVREQTYKNLEIIIVDDCSTDDTHAYLKEISDLDQRIHYFIKEKNSGACVSRNIAIENSTGEYITGLDDDDYFINDRIQIFVDNIDKLTKYAFIFSSFYMESQKRKVSSRFNPIEVSREHLLYNNYVGNQIFCKAEDFKKVGFDINLKAWQDLDCWLKLLGNKKCLLIRIPTYVMDVDDRVRITNSNKGQKMINVFDYFVEKHELNEKEKKILSCQLIGYGVKKYYKYSLVGLLKNICNIWFIHRFFGLTKRIF